MAEEKRYPSGIPIIIALIATLITGQIVRSYEISLLPGTLITITIAVILWYGFTFFKKSKIQIANLSKSKFIELSIGLFRNKDL